MGSIDDSPGNCWVTLITKDSYLPGVIILAHTLNQHGSKYPLVVQYTSGIDDDIIEVLQAEANRSGRIVLDHVAPLQPPKGQEKTSIVAARFADTFTKLRAFEVYRLGYTKACFLDADMAIFRNPDEIFDIQLPDHNWLAANHGCVCNLDQDPWAAADWNKGNCAFTKLVTPDEVCETPVGDCRPTYRLLNGGMFLFHASQGLWDRILHTFNHSSKLSGYQFPDQDFLADFFWDKWQPVSWKYNALKTMRYWHPKMWSDEKVVVVHFIVDKPWTRKVSDDGIAGHLGRDGETHQWWWDIYEEWLSTQQKANSGVLTAMSKLVNTEEPFHEKTPLPQEPGKPEDVRPYPPY